LSVARKVPCSRPLTTEDRVTLDEAKAALQRGRHVVLVLPPDVEQAAAVWELVGAPAVIVCADHGSAAEWAAAAPAGVRVHAVTGLSRATQILRTRAVPLLAGAVQDLAALVARSVLKLDAISTVVVAWPETLVSGEHAAALDTLLGETHEARRIVLSWNPAALGDFLERHARRARRTGAARHGGPAAVPPFSRRAARGPAAAFCGGPGARPHRRARRRDRPARRRRCHRRRARAPEPAVRTIRPGRSGGGAA